MIEAGPGTAPLPRLDRFLEMAGEVLVVTDFEGRLLRWNRALERTLGYPPEVLAGFTLDDMIHPEDRPVRDGLAARVAAGEEISGIVIRSRAATGEWRWLEWTARLDRARHQIFAVGRDVSAQREAVVALEEEEGRMRAILDHSPSVVFIRDLEGRYLEVNRVWCDALGTTREEVLGRSPQELFADPNNRTGVEDADRALLESGGPMVLEEEVETSQGRRTYTVTRFLLHDGQGAPYAMAGIGSEITFRRAAEAALEQRERVLTTIFETSPDIITLLDRYSRAVRVSPAERAVLGTGFPDAIPAEGEMRERIHPDDLERLVASFGELMGGRARQVTVRYRTRHGDSHWVDLDTRARSVLDGAGTVVGAVLVIRDVTAKIEAEGKLHEVIQSAEAASLAKSEFLSRMSHELRTPLNSVLGFAQLLQLDELPQSQGAAVEQILRAGRHLLDMIDEVLDIARSETGRLELVMEAVVVADVVADAVGIVQPLADRAGLTLGDRPEDESQVVRADRQRLLQVLLNLLSNAVKYNLPGGRIDLRCAPAGPGWLRLTVTDTGPGIDPAGAAGVFEPFERLGADRRGIEGTGVGLALSHRLAEAMGGRLDFESVPGEGSSFFVELRSADSPGWEPAGGRVAPGPTGGVFRVLVVDSDLTTVDLIEQVLVRRPEVEVLVAMHGILGLDLAREHRPGLVLLASELPDMAWSDVLARLRADPLTAALPVAVVSPEEAPARLVRQLLADGVVGHLAKPFDVRALLDLVDTLQAGPAGGPPA